MIPIVKHCRSQNFDFQGLKKTSIDQFLASSNSADIISLLNFLLQLKHQRSGENTESGWGKQRLRFFSTCFVLKIFHFNYLFIVFVLDISELHPTFSCE